MSFDSKHERDFYLACQAEGLPEPEQQYKFCKTRKFRADFCWPFAKLLVEIEGGEWMRKGRHTSGKGYTQDCEKYNLATIEGWRVLRFSGGMIIKDPCKCARLVGTLLKQKNPNINI